MTDVSFLSAMPTIVDLPAPMNHTEGDRFELVCSFTGVPAPEISWEKNGSVFLLGEGKKVIHNIGMSQLEISNLTLHDAGVYSCSASNIAGSATKSARLRVRGEGISWKHRMLLIPNS